MKYLRMASLALGFAMASCVTGVASQSPVSSAGTARGGMQAPFDITSIRGGAKPDNRGFLCGTPPDALRDIQLSSIYGNLTTNRSVIDPDSYDAYIEGSAPIREFQNGLTQMANRYINAPTPRPDIAACTLSWLAAWADGGALMGDMNATGESIRKWTLSSVAMTYLQIRDDRNLDPAQRRRVEDWMRRVSKTVIADFSRDADKASRRNNHLYWAAWGVAAAGVALNDSGMFNWAMARAQFGIDQIGPDGTLPLETARGQKALQYHSFAAIPLIMMAEIGFKNGVNLYNRNNGGLHRLTRRILGSLDDTSYFDRIAGAKQDIIRTITPATLVWLEPYNARFPGVEESKWIAQLRPLRAARVGGNATLLYGR